MQIVEQIESSKTMQGLAMCGVHVNASLRDKILTPSMLCFIRDAYGKRLLELLPLDCNLETDKDFLECKDLFFKISETKKLQRV